MTTPATPAVGDLATLYYPQDSYPYIVIAVSASGSKVTLEELEPAITEPVAMHNGWPVIDCDGDPAKRTGRIAIAWRQGDGKYMSGPSQIGFGRARYHRDWSD